MVVANAAIRQELSLARLAADAARAEASAPKTMTEAYPTFTLVLHQLCTIDTDDELPPFWKLYATLGGKKGHALATFQQLIDQRSMEATSTGVAPLFWLCSSNASPPVDWG